MRAASTGRPVASIGYQPHKLRSMLPGEFGTPAMEAVETAAIAKHAAPSRLDDAAQALGDLAEQAAELRQRHEILARKAADRGLAARP
jgi:hypothetical protein